MRNSNMTKGERRWSVFTDRNGT